MNEDFIHAGLVDEDEILLDDAGLALALLDHAGTDLAPYEDVLEAIAARLAVIGGGSTAAPERAAALATVLAEEFGFVGDAETYDDPANVDLIRVIDRRRGLPVSLAILYVAAAHRLGWSAVSWTCRAMSWCLSVEKPLQSSWIPSAVEYRSTGTSSPLWLLYSRMTMMAPDYGQAWWERARLELVDGDVPGARHSLAAMLEITRDPDLRERVSATLDALGRSSA